MIWRNLGIVAVLFVGLGAFVYFYEIDGGKKRAEEAERAKKLFQFEKEEVTSITLARSGDPITMQKEDDAWKLVAPIEARADETAVDGLASELSSTQVERSLEPSPVDWKNFGLENPSIKIRVALKDGQTLELELGEKNFNRSSVFGRIPGQEKVLILPDLLYSNAEKELFDFRDKTVLDFDREQVREVEIRSRRKTYRLEKNGEDWSIRKPIQARADRSEIRSILSDLELARVEEFVERGTGGLGTYGLRVPASRVDLYLGENRAKKTLLVGKKVGTQYYAKDETGEDVFKIKEDLVEKFDLDLGKLRDKKMARFERNEVKRIEVKLPDQRFEFLKDSEDEWRMQSPEGHQGKSVLEYKLFWPLEDLEGKEIIDQANLDDPKYGFGEPSAEVKVVKKDDQVIEVVLGKTDGEVVFGKTASDSTLYKVDKKVLEDLNFKVDEILEKSE
jgi:hypothetical protein